MLTADRITRGESKKSALFPDYNIEMRLAAM